VIVVNFTFKPALLYPSHRGMQSCAYHLSDGRIAILCQSIHTTADQKIGAQILSQAEQFKDIALAVTYMNTALRYANELRGQAQVIQPTHAFFLLNRHPSGVNLALEGVGSLELRPRPEFCGCQAKRQSLRRDRQTGMHQKPTRYMSASMCIAGSCKLHGYQTPPEKPSFQTLAQRENCTTTHQCPPENTTGVTI
jgi:hypothetical protein